MSSHLFLKPPTGWLNDPNGFIYYNGEYHLFYQHFPFAPVWGRMHWGHAVSSDLVTWEHLPIALYPSKDYDCDGIFSGSAIDIDGKLYLYYTGVKYTPADPDNINIPNGTSNTPCQCLITSDNGYDFDNINNKCKVIDTYTDDTIGNPYEARDPKVWFENGKYYMCLGSSYKYTEGVLLVYSSTNALDWELTCRIQDSRLGNILECPDIFNVNDRWILVASPMGIAKDTDYYEHQSVIQMIDWDADAGSLNLIGESRFLDYGMDIYAPQSTVDESGQRLLVAWLRMPIPVQNDCGVEHPNRGASWIGMMTSPRVITCKEGHVYTAIHPNVYSYFNNNDCATSINIDGIPATKVDDNIYLKHHLNNGDSLNVYGFIIGLEDGTVSTDRSMLLPNDSNIHTSSSSPYVGSECDIEVIMNNNIVEVYINGGQYVITNAIYRRQ